MKEKSEHQHSTDAEQVINEVLEWSKDFDFKQALHVMFIGYMDSNAEILPEERQRIVFAYQSLKGLLENIDDYNTYLDTAKPSGIDRRQFN